MKIIPLSEGTFTIDKTKKFVPFNLTEDNLQQRTVGSLLVEIQPFVIITSKDVLLLDTGLGFLDAGGSSQLHQNLIKNNINPGDVTKVLLSHLHKDHAGGILSAGTGGSALANFPQATYYVNKEEYDFAVKTGMPSYLPSEFTALGEMPNVVFTTQNGHINDYIKYEVTRAHSPFHQVFWIEEDGQKVFFGADDAPQLQQMKSRFVAKYDYDGKKCMELRKEWWQKGQEEKWTFLFYHDIKSPVYEF